MKNINLICKIEISNSFENVIKNLLDYSNKKSRYNFTISICSNVDCPETIKNELQQNVKIYYCAENQNLNNLVNEVICNSTQDYTICCALNDFNWEHKISKIIENLDSGVEVCKVSKLLPPNKFINSLINFFIKFYFCFVNMFSVNISKNLDVTDFNFQGFTQKPIFIMKNMKDYVFLYRCTNSFLLFDKKVLFLKKNNNSIKVEHLVKKGISKTQMISFYVLFAGLLLSGLTFPFLLNIYVLKNAIFKFVTLNILILGSSIVFAIFNFFSEEVKKYIF